MKRLPLMLTALTLACMLAILGCAALPAEQNEATSDAATTVVDQANSPETSQDIDTAADTSPNANGGGTDSVRNLSFAIDQVPPYDGTPTVAINDDDPYFLESELQRKPFMEFSLLDSRGRCGAAYALFDVNMMPTEPRESIGDVKPSGWQIERYDWVEGEYLFNRCHLLGYQLSGQNANKLNLITGTRYMNVLGMEPFESRVANYLQRTGNHVLYRCTPVFEGDNLVASGVLLEALSVEDAGEGIRFCRWCYNVEPGVAIDYATGENHADGTMSAGDSVYDSSGDAAAKSQEATPAAAAAAAAATAASEVDGEAENTEQEVVSEEQEAAAEQEVAGDVHTYILNTNSQKFHWPGCEAVDKMSERNKQEFTGTREEVLAMGYRPCGICMP